MLNPLNKKLDSTGIWDSLVAFPEQCHQVIREISTQAIPNQCYLAENIVISGMGGSALPAEIFSSYYKDYEILVHRDYGMPEMSKKINDLFALDHTRKD